MPSHVHVVLGCGAVAASIAVGRIAADPAATDGRAEPAVAEAVGPDIIVGSISAVQKYGTIDGVTAYAIGTTSCNIGDVAALWCAQNIAGLCDSNQHPVIAQNLYRLADGRIEQIGMSWVKHGFCAVNETLCGSCRWTDCNTLGVGCSDPYVTALNGNQNGLGPRSQINAATGVFPYPFTAPPVESTLSRRIRVANADLDPELNPGALYFAEAHYVAADDHAAGNGSNNASHRRINVGAISLNGFLLGVAGTTAAQLPAIHAWHLHGLGVNTPDPDVHIVDVDVPDDGRFIVGHKVRDLGDGTWDYEFAVHNLFSDRSAGRFTVPLPDGVAVLSVGQSIINHHSGEAYSTAPWTIEIEEDAIVWSTDAFEVDENANALRWGTLFNFRFVVDAPPIDGLATIGLFKPGDAPDPQVAVQVPAPKPTCPFADLDCDGAIDGADLGLLLSAWGSNSVVADLDGNGIVDAADLGLLLTSWMPDAR